jgi:hypothetical protein
MEAGFIEIVEFPIFNPPTPDELAAATTSFAV